MHAAVSKATERDRDIVELLRKDGRDRAFEELLCRYEGKVYRLCCALLRDRAQAEDTAQESLVRVWKALDRYDGRASLSSWIYAITRNRCLTALEKRRSLDSLDELSEEAEFGLPAPGDPMKGARSSCSAWWSCSRSDCAARWCSIITRSDSVSEVALMLGCPEGTVKTTLFRARAALAEMLKRRGLDDPAYWQEDTP